RSFSSSAAFLISSNVRCRCSARNDAQRLLNPSLIAPAGKKHDSRHLSPFFTQPLGHILKRPLQKILNVIEGVLRGHIRPMWLQVQGDRRTGTLQTTTTLILPSRSCRRKDRSFHRR